MPFRKVPHPKVADSVADEFETLLLHGVLRPGDRLPPERELAETLGVSRSSLREAMDALSERGLIQRRQGSGAQVSELIASSLVDPLGEMIAGRPETLRDYLAFRRLIERDAAIRAAERAAKADRDRIDRLMERARAARAAGDLRVEAALDVEFHMAVVEAAGNAVTTQVMRALGRALISGMETLRAKVYARPDFADVVLVQHDAIVQAIADGAPDRAAAACDAHLDYVEGELAAAEEALRLVDLAERRLARDA